ncbi:MAG: type I-B CRISPR-associated endonuclease Cas1b [Bacillota bacterium]|jgi:CRISPR-associated protein Cas1
MNMRTILLFSDGRLARKDNTIVFDYGDRKRFLPIQKIDEILIFGEVDLNKRFLEFCSKHGIVLHFFNYYEYYAGSYYPREHYNSGHMLLRQVAHYIDPEKRLQLARGFVEGAIRNIRQVLKYYQNRGRNLSDTIERIECLNEDVQGANSIETLMAIEGNAHATYYKSFDEIIKNPDFVFEKRTRRPPQNYVNTLISLGNSILYTTVLSEIYKTHLDPRIGYLHTTNWRRFTLNLDIAEVFKPIIVDRAIFTVVNDGRIKADDFVKESGGVFLKDNGRKTFIAEIMQKLQTTVKHRALGRSVSYRRLIRMELYKLEKHLLGEKEYTPFVALW